jgi:hypothetical protein
MPLLRNALCNAPASAALFFLSALHNKNNYSLPASPRNNQSSAGESIHRPYSSGKSRPWCARLGLLISPSGNQHVAQSSVKCEINFLRIAATILIGWHQSYFFSERGFANTPSVPFFDFLMLTGNHF